MAMKRAVRGRGAIWSTAQTTAGPSHNEDGKK
jgi:hypothetical protein